MGSWNTGCKGVGLVQVREFSEPPVMRGLTKPLKFFTKPPAGQRKLAANEKMTRSARSEGSFFSSETPFLLGLSRRIVYERGPSRGKVSVLIPSSPAMQDIAPPDV